MKRFHYILTIIFLLGACTPEENGKDDNTNSKETIVTSDAKDITEASAVLTGYANITPDMGNVTIGVLYSMNATPTLDNSVELSSKELDENNHFSVKATSLSSNTTYYYKAFVQYGGVYRYGVAKSFTTHNVSAHVTTSNPSDIGMFSATIKGVLTIDSKSELESSVWFLYGTTNNLESLKSAGNKVTSTLSGDNSFSCKLSGLEYGKTYYYVACAKVYDTEFYSEVSSFSTTQISAGITTAEPTDIGLFTVTFNGSLSVENTESLSKNVWFLYSNKANNVDALKSSGIQRTTTLKDNGTYSFTQTDLNYATTYYYVACAKIHDKEYYGNVVEFSTSDIIATTETMDASAIGQSKATISGQLTVGNSETLEKSVWFLYGSKNDLEFLKGSGEKLSASINSNGSFSVSLSGLNLATTYYYVACSKVYDKEFYGEVKSFTTTSPSVATIKAESVGLNYATVYGRIYSQQDNALSIDPWFLYGTVNDLESLKSSGTKITAGISYQYSWYLLYYNLTGLDYGTTYYYVACAKIGDTVFYGDVMSFTTSDLSVELTTLNATVSDPFTATVSAKLVVNEMYNTEKPVWFLWGSSGDLETLKANGTKLTAQKHWSENNVYYAYLTDLDYNTKYYYVACSEVYDRVFYGEVKSFSTPAIEAYTTDASDIKLTTARLNGKLSCGYRDNHGMSAWFIYGDSNDLETLSSNGTKVDAVLQSNGTFAYVVKNLIDEQTIYYIAYAKVEDEVFHGIVRSLTTKKNTDYGNAVDMGLSVKWRDCNIGATYKADYGLYYAWGVTEPRGSSPYSYKWYDSSSNQYLKYNSDESKGVVDNKSVLDPEDDVAYVKLGGKWRMPTKEEWKELWDNSTCTWSSYNGVNGLLVTSKKNGNTLFFPATGWYGWDGPDLAREGEQGFFWSSSLFTPSETYNGMVMTAYSSGLWYHEASRSSGCTVRPVLEE